MKIADHIKYSLSACGSRELDKAMLFACLAIDGTAKKMYPQIDRVGARFKKFIVEHKKQDSFTLLPSLLASDKEVPEFEQGGGVILGNGKPGFPGGTVLPKSNIRIERNGP